MTLVSIGCKLNLTYTKNYLKTAFLCAPSRQTHDWLNAESHRRTVYPKKYAHGFCFAVLCCGYTLTDFPISIRLTSLALWQSNDCPSASKATLMNMDKYFMWIHYERLHNHNKAKHNKTVCIFLGIYCRLASAVRQWMDAIYARIFCKYLFAQAVNFKSESYDETQVLTLRTRRISNFLSSLPLKISAFQCVAYAIIVLITNAFPSESRETPVQHKLFEYNMTCGKIAQHFANRSAILIKFYA